MDMNNSQYKKYHESFMQNNHGSTAFHTAFCIYFTLQCTLLCAIKQERNDTVKYIEEYFIIILPLILAHTVWSDYIFVLNLGAFLHLLYEIIKNWKLLDVKKSMTSENIYNNNRIQTITCLRGLTYLITGLCILAVDFKDFPRHLAKTENYGYSLMDTGVGLFILISGLVHRNINKNNCKSVIKGNTKFVVILLLLGVGRYWSVKQLDYQEHVTEYGVHWNFFFTLAICKLFSSILLALTSNALLLSILTLSLHEFLLYNGLQSWVFSDKTRVTFIDANREGISSSLGYIALYLFAAHLKQVLNTGKVKRYYILRKLVSKFVILFVISCVINKFRPISRTLANAGYCSYLSTVVVFGVIIMYLLEVMFQDKMRFRMPTTLQHINSNGLIYFLICNLSTGAINLSFRTLLLPSVATFVILNFYMIFTITSTIYLNKKGIQI